MHRIGLLVADRKFVGSEWAKALTERKIPFCLRFPKTHPVRLPDRKVWRVDELLTRKKERFYQRILVDGQWLNMYLRRLEGAMFCIWQAPHPRVSWAVCNVHKLSR